MAEQHKTYCPSCGGVGRSVRRITLESLIRSEHLCRISDQPYFVCTGFGCSIVYFNQKGHTFDEAALKVPFGLKGTSKPMTICYCFAFAAEDIHEEIARTGQTTVLDQIQMRMKDEGCRCESENPIGRCCLDTVRSVIEGASGASCGVDQPPARSRAGVLAVGGSVLAAMLSSVCCWLPLLLIAFGASAAGVAGFFEQWRIPFIVSAIVLLAVGFFVTYRPVGDAKACCQAGNSRMMRMNRAMLWVATVFVGAMVLFPSYVNALIGTAAVASQHQAVSANSVKFIIPIEGMTCAGCAATVKQALSMVRGITVGDVSYEKERAVVTISNDNTLVREALVKALSDAGFDSTPPASWKPIFAKEVRLTSLADSIDPLRDHFNANKDRHRFVTLLSPT